MKLILLTSFATQSVLAQSYLSSIMRFSLEQLILLCDTKNAFFCRCQYANICSVNVDSIFLRISTAWKKDPQMRLTLHKILSMQIIMTFFSLRVFKIFLLSWEYEYIQFSNVIWLYITWEISPSLNCEFMLFLTSIFDDLI